MFMRAVVECGPAKYSEPLYSTAEAWQTGVSRSGWFRIGPNVIPPSEDSA